MILMISEQEFNLLLQKFKTGTCTESELRSMDDHLEQRTQHEHHQAPGKVISETFEKLNLAIDDHERSLFQRKRLVNIAARIAAVLFIFISGALMLYRQRTPIYNFFYPVKYTTITTKKGQILKVDLADGSTVILDQNTQLTYSNRYNQLLREVSLNGEAYFTVTKNRSKAFIVHTGALNTRVLGTSFNVEAYPFSQKVVVTLITGKVWLTANGTGRAAVNTVILPNQMLTYDKITGNAEKSDVSEALNYTAWREAKIRFSNTTMEEAIRRLNIAFRSHISISDNTLSVQKIYGEFGTNEKIENIVENLCLLTKASYRVDHDGEILIYPAINKRSNLKPQKATL